MAADGEAMPSAELGESARAAILMMALGEEEAANVLRHMEPEEVQRLGRAMTDIAGVTQDAIGSTLDRFVERIRTESSLGLGSTDYFRSTVTRALGADRATSVMSRLGSRTDDSALETLKWMDPRMIARLLRNEHPQIIATVISHLPRTQGGEVLKGLPEDMHTDIVMRVIRLDSVHPVALTELDDVIQQAFQQDPEVEIAGIGGVKVAAELLNATSKESEEMVLEAINEIDPDLCNDLRENMFIFENLLGLDDRGMQTLLRDVASDNLIIALKGASVDMQQKIFRNMSKRAADILQDDLAAKGPVKLSDVETAQRDILLTAKQLSEEGKIALNSKGDEFV